MAASCDAAEFPTTTRILPPVSELRISLSNGLNRGMGRMPQFQMGRAPHDDEEAFSHRDTADLRENSRASFEFWLPLGFHWLLRVEALVRRMKSPR